MNDTTLFTLGVLLVLVTDAALVWLGFTLGRRRSSAPPPAATPPPAAPPLDPLGASLAVVSERVTRMEQQINSLSEPRPPRIREAGPKVFEVAAKLVRQGAGVEELMSLCDVTRGEAELILTLNARPGGPQPGGPESGDPRSGVPRSGDPRSGDPRSGDPAPERPAPGP